MRARGPLPRGALPDALKERIHAGFTIRFVSAFVAHSDQRPFARPHSDSDGACASDDCVRTLHRYHRTSTTEPNGTPARPEKAPRPLNRHMPSPKLTFESMTVQSPLRDFFEQELGASNQGRRFGTEVQVSTEHLVSHLVEQTVHRAALDAATHRQESSAAPGGTAGVSWKHVLMVAALTELRPVKLLSKN